MLTTLITPIYLQQTTTKGSENRVDTQKTRWVFLGKLT